MSESLRSLTKNERMSQSLVYLSESLICSFFCSKNERFAQKTLEQIPSPASWTRLLQRITGSKSRLSHNDPVLVQGLLCNMVKSLLFVGWVAVMQSAVLLGMFLLLHLLSAANNLSEILHQVKGKGFLSSFPLENLLAKFCAWIWQKRLSCFWQFYLF